MAQYFYDLNQGFGCKARELKSNFVLILSLKQFIIFERLKLKNMAEENIIENLATSLGQNASVKNVFGEPVRVGDKTIIPVAKLAYGFGGGFGQGRKKGKSEVVEGENENESPVGKGAGGGGGFNAVAKGIYEITPTSTRFIPANPARKILTGIMIGYLLKKFFFSHKKK